MHCSPVKCRSLQTIVQCIEVWYRNAGMPRDVHCTIYHDNKIKVQFYALQYMGMYNIVWFSLWKYSLSLWFHVKAVKTQDQASILNYLTTLKNIYEVIWLKTVHYHIENPKYGRQSISWPMLIVASMPWDGGPRIHKNPIFF